MSLIVIDSYQFAAAISPNTAYRDAVLADSPWALWMMDEGSGTTMEDSSGNNRDGAYSGADLTGTDTALGAHARFDGTNDYGIVQNPYYVFANQRSVTLEFLLKVNGTWAEEIVIEYGTNYGLLDGLAAYTISSTGRLYVGMSERISSNSYFIEKKYDMSSTADEFFVSATFDRTNGSPALDVRIDGVAATPASTLDTMTAVTVQPFSDSRFFASRASSSLFNSIELSGVAVFHSILSNTRRDAHFDATGL